MSKLVRLRPASSHDHGRQVHISKLTQLQPPSVSPNSLNYGLHKCFSKLPLTISECISKFTRSRPPSASPNSLDYGLHVHLQTLSMTACNCISTLARLRPPCVSPNTLDYRLQVHLQSRSIMATECSSEFTRSSFSGAPRIALKRRLQPIQIYRV